MKSINVSPDQNAPIFCPEDVCLLCLLHIIQVDFRLDKLMEVNNMNPDQTAPKHEHLKFVFFAYRP